MATFWWVVGAVVVAGLVAAFLHDRRAARRAVRDGRAPGEVRPRGIGDPEAYRSSPGTHPNGWGGGTGGV
jgi:hypothetical protein